MSDPYYWTPPEKPAYLSKTELLKSQTITPSLLISSIQDSGLKQHFHEIETILAKLLENTKMVLWIVDAQSRRTLYVSPSYKFIWERISRKSLI